MIIMAFITLLLATFVAVLAINTQSGEQQRVARRMAVIHSSAKRERAAGLEPMQLLKAARVDKFGWLSGRVASYRFAQKLEILILQANSTTTVANLILAGAGLLIAGYCLAWLFTSVALIDLAVGLALGCLPYTFLSFKRARRISAFNKVLAECIDMMARALRAGHSVASAMEMLAENAGQPAAAEFGEIFRQQNLGLPLREALMQLLDRVPSPDLRVLVTAILVQRDTGGNLVEILERTVFVIRERLRIQGEIQTQTAQGRMTGWILTALPAVMMALLNMVNPGYSGVLFHDPFGRKLLYYSLGMLLIGGFIIRKIVNGIEV